MVAVGSGWIDSCFKIKIKCDMADTIPYFVPTQFPGIDFLLAQNTGSRNNIFSIFLSTLNRSKGPTIWGRQTSFNKVYILDTHRARWIAKT